MEEDINVIAAIVVAECGVGALMTTGTETT